MEIQPSMSKATLTSALAPQFKPRISREGKIQGQSPGQNYKYNSPKSLSLEAECEELQAKNELLKHQLKEVQKKLLNTKKPTTATTTARKLNFSCPWHNENGEVNQKGNQTCKNQGQEVSVNEEERVHSLMLSYGKNGSSAFTSMSQQLQNGCRIWNQNQYRLRKPEPEPLRKLETVYSNVGIDLHEKENFKDFSFDVDAVVEHIQNQISNIIFERDALSCEKERLLRILENQFLNSSRNGSPKNDHYISKNKVEDEEGVRVPLTRTILNSKTPHTEYNCDCKCDCYKKTIMLDDLTSQVAFQQNTIEENYETIQILTETLSLMSNYISQLELSQKNDGNLDLGLDMGIDLNGTLAHNCDQFPIKSYCIQATQSSVDNEFHQWMQSVNTKLSNITETIAALVSERESSKKSNKSIPKLGAKSVSQTAKVSDEKSIIEKGIPMSIPSQNENCTNEAKVYTIVESKGIINLSLVKDMEETSVKTFFKFENCLELWSGSVCYQLKFTLQRTYSHKFGDSMSLSVCFPKICDCCSFLDCLHLEKYFGRCLIFVQLLYPHSNPETSLLQNCYTVDVGKGNCEISENSKFHLNCRPTDYLILDPHFCSFQTFNDLNLKSEDSLSFQIGIYRLPYVNVSSQQQNQNEDQNQKLKNYSIQNIIRNSAKIRTLEGFEEKNHTDCQELIFKCHNHNMPSSSTFSSRSNIRGGLKLPCSCILAAHSPLIRLLMLPKLNLSKFNTSEDSLNYSVKLDMSVKRLSSSNSNPPLGGCGCLEVLLEEISKEAISVFISLISSDDKNSDVEDAPIFVSTCGSSSASDWKTDIKLNLELFELAQQFMIADLANICTQNLIVCPKSTFNFELSLKLYCLGRKFKNCDFVCRANQLFGGNYGKHSQDLTMALSSIPLVSTSMSTCF